MHTPKTHLVFTHSGVMAWNIPAHMLSGAIAYQTLRHENPAKITTVTVVLRHYPSFETHWRAQFEGLPAADRDEIVFMFAARWADDLRTSDRSQQRGSWHYINWPFKPEGQPESVRTKPPGNKKILTALAENERIAKAESTPTPRAVALTWLFHLVGDVHQPLHTSQIFTVDYPDGHRGGNEICVRPASSRRGIDLHRFWDSVIRKAQTWRGSGMKQPPFLLHRVRTSQLRLEQPSDKRTRLAPLLLNGRE